MSDPRYFVVLTLDKLGAQDLRVENRPAHLAFMKGLGVDAKVGGPLMSDDGEERIGGMYVLQATSLEDAKRQAAADPYVAAGLFETMLVKEWRWQTSNI